MRPEGWTGSPLQGFWEAYESYRKRNGARVLGAKWTGRNLGNRMEWVNENPDAIDLDIALRRSREMSREGVKALPLPPAKPQGLARAVRRWLSRCFRHLAYLCDNGRPWELDP